jgi:hypothetical protein
MAEPQEQLTPADFPLHSDQRKVRGQDGKPIADTDNEKMAGEIADRLNADEERREEDKWSA